MTFESVPIENRKQWLGLRKQCVVTASTVPALLTRHPYESPWGIYNRAIGLIGDGSGESDAIREAGQDAELMIPARVRRQRPQVRLIKNLRFYRDSDLGLGATPDFIDTARPNSIWQAKSTVPDRFFAEWKEGPPLWMQLQLQAEMLATGAVHGGLVCLVRDRYFSTYLWDFEPHEGAQAAIIEAVRDMKRRVEEEDPPEPDFQVDADRLINLLPPPIATKSIDLTTDNRAVECAAEYGRLSAIISEAEASRKALKAELLDKIQDAEVATCGTFRVSTKMVAATEIPASTRKSYRTFSISERS